MPMINNDVSVIKGWLDRGGSLESLLKNYNNNIGSIDELFTKIDTILQNAPDDLNTFYEVFEYLNSYNNELKSINDKLDDKVGSDEIETVKRELKEEINLKADASYAFDDHYVITLSSEEYSDVNDILNKISETIDVTYSSRLCRVTINIDYGEYPPTNMESILLEGHEANAPYFLLFGHVNPASTFNIYYKDVPGGEWKEMPKGGADLTVDSELSETSENPVQNKVITAELNASIKMSEYIDLYDNIVEYFNSKTGFGAEFVQYDGDGGATEPQTLIFTWGGFQNDEFFDYQTVIFPNGEIYHRTKNYGEEWLTPEESINFWGVCGWERISVSQTDLKAADKVPALKMNPAIEIKSGAGYLNWEELTEMDVPEGVSIIYSVDNISASTYEYGLLIKSLGDYEQLVVMCPNGEIRETHRDYDTGEWLEWISPYVTPTDFNNAIGDIETALDNIINIQNQLIGSNSINIVQDDIILKDNTTNTNYKVYVSDGELTMSLESGVE